MKLISDFDGVWTNPLGEADAVRAEAHRQAAGLTKVTVEEAREHLAGASASLLLMPARFGWVIEGGISAFSDEDPFVHNNAISHFLEQLPDHRDWVSDSSLFDWLLKLRAAATAAHGDLAAYANQIFFKGVQKFLEEEPPSPSTEVQQEIGAFIEQGHEVVIVSNSSTGKITDFLGRSELPFCVGGPDATELGKIRVRGGAMKFVIGTSPNQFVELAGRRIRTDRASYDRILGEEQGDAVIGDVVSLDLALPLARERAGQKAMLRFLVERAYTPSWSLEAAEEAGFQVLGGLHELPSAWASNQ